MNAVAVFCVVLMGVLPAAMPKATFAEVYTYKDSKGTVTYVDDLGKIPGKYRSRARAMVDRQSVSIIESVSPPAGDARSGRKQPAQRQAKERFSGTIEMYVTSWCPVCTDAEIYLKKMQYPFVKYDVEKDKSAKERADGYPGRGVPLMVVGKRTMRGFSPEALEHYMDN